MLIFPLFELQEKKERRELFVIIFDKLFMIFCFADAPMDISGKDASLKIWMVPIYVSRLVIVFYRLNVLFNMKIAPFFFTASRQRVMLETASIAGGATIAVFLVVIICITAYIHCKRKQKELRSR